MRIVRDEFRQASIKGIFPCGEGAGYAGGITSAGVDGVLGAGACHVLSIRPQGGVQAVPADNA